MIRFNTKDVALVAFAAGLLAFEAVALQETVPAVKQSLARLAGLDPARIASRLVSPAGAAGASVLDGAGQVARAAVDAAQATAVVAAEDAVTGATRSKTTYRSTVIRRGAAPVAHTGGSCLVVVTDDARAAKARMQVVTLASDACRARVRAAERREVEAIRRAISERRHDATTHRTIEVGVGENTGVESSTLVNVQTSSH